jgi:hypothetical protein
LTNRILQIAILKVKNQIFGTCQYNPKEGMKPSWRYSLAAKRRKRLPNGRFESAREENVPVGESEEQHNVPLVAPEQHNQDIEDRQGFDFFDGGRNESPSRVGFDFFHGGRNKSPRRVVAPSVPLFLPEEGVHEPRRNDLTALLIALDIIIIILILSTL